MQALDFMMYCVGVGVVLVSSAHAFRVLSDTKARGKIAKDAIQRREEPLDPMGKRLQEFRSAQFGRPMERPQQPPQTWPVMGVRSSPPAPPKRNKDSDKKQGDK